MPEPTTLKEIVDEMMQGLLAQVKDPEERAALLDIAHNAADEQRARNAWWDAHRARPKLDGREFTPTTPIDGPVPDEAPPYGPPGDHMLDGTEMWDKVYDREGKPKYVPRDTPGYRCLRCRDSGWVRRDVAVGHPDFGVPMKCLCQTESPAARAALIKERLVRSGLAVEQLHCTVESFVRVTGTQGALNAVYAIATAHRTGGDGPRWLVLYGEPGTGKSHLLVAALQQMLPMQEGFAATVGQFLEACKANQFARDVELTQHATEAPILLFDEVGAQGDGDWGREKLERILNTRYEKRLWTLLGITVARENVEAWSPRLASRFADRRIAVSVTLTCEDYRKTTASPKMPRAPR